MDKVLKILVGLALFGAGSAGWASEGTRIQIAGVKTVSVAPLTGIAATSARPEVAPEIIEIGATLPLHYMMVVNLKDYDLPRPRDGWVYFEVGQEIYRVDLNSREILELVAVRLR